MSQQTEDLLKQLKSTLETELKKVKPEYETLKVEVTNESVSDIKISLDCSDLDSKNKKDFLNNRALIVQKIYKVVNDQLSLENGYPSLIIQAIVQKESNDSVELRLNAPILLEPEKYTPIFNKKIDVLMEEYKTLRQELIGEQTALNNMFYYGLVVLGFTLAAIQGVMGQINGLFKPDIQALDLETSRFYGLTFFLFILLAVFIPTASTVFITKWMSIARSVAVHGSYLSGIEKRINRAFAEITIQDGTKYFFDDDYLNIGWETNIRKARELTKKTYLVFGGYHIFVIIGFYGFLGLFSHFVTLFLFDISWAKLCTGNHPSMLGIIWLLGFVILLVIVCLTQEQYYSAKEWLVATSFDDAIEKEKYKTKEWSKTNYCKKLGERCQQSCYFKLFLILYVIYFVFVILIFCFAPEKKIFSEDRITMAKQEIIFSTYTKKIDSIVESQDKNLALKLKHFDILADEGKLKLENSKVTHPELDDKVEEFKKYFKLRKMTNLAKADLRNADLKDVDLSNSNLTGADLTGADLTNTNLKGANLKDVKGIDCKKSSDKQKFISDETTIGIDGKKGSCSTKPSTTNQGTPP
jgi:hypothetical protein